MYTTSSITCHDLSIAAAAAAARRRLSLQHPAHDVPTNSAGITWRQALMHCLAWPDKSSKEIGVARRQALDSWRRRHLRLSRD